MQEREFAERLSRLRNIRGVSARKMSIALGKSHSYINSVENCKSKLTMDSFFKICEYLEVTPSEFFDVEVRDPKGAHLLVEKIRKLDENQTKHILAIINELVGSHRL